MGGFFRLPKSLAGRRDLSATAKLVWGAIRDHQRENSQAWPLVHRLADMCGCRRDAVLEGIAALERAELLKVRRRNGARSVYELVAQPVGKTDRSETATSRENRPVGKSHRSEKATGPVGKTDRQPNRRIIDEEEEEDIVPETGTQSSNDDRDQRAKASAVVEAWNALAKGHGLPIVRTPLSKPRLAKLRARLTENGWPWREAIERIPTRSFLTGDNDRGWRANLDWFIRPDSASKVTEGVYDNQQRSAARVQAPEGKYDELQAQAEARARGEPPGEARTTAQQGPG